MQAVHAEAGLLVEASAAEEEPAGRVVGNVLPQLAEDVATQLTDLAVAAEKHDVVDLARPAPQSDFDGQPHPSVRVLSPRCVTARGAHDASVWPASRR